jgi:ParB family chromosome partitioning protein
MARQQRPRASAVDAMTDHAPADRASIKLIQAPDKLAGTGRLRGAMMVPLAMIRRDDSQPRELFDADDLNLLAQSIRSRGVLQPIRVRWDDVRSAWILVSGERRYRAAMLAGLSEVPAVESTNPDAVLGDQLVENMVRADLTHTEQAKGLKRFMEETGLNQSQAAAELGISRGQASKLLQFLAAPPEVQKKLDAGEISTEAAYDLAKAEPARAVEIAGQGGTTRDIRRKAATATRARSSTRELTWAEGRVTITLKNPDATDDDFRVALGTALDLI